MTFQINRFFTALRWCSISFRMTKTLLNTRNIFILTALLSILMFAPTGKTKAQMELNIISRAEWGADEDFRYCQWWDKAAKKCGEVDQSKEIWPREYAPIKKIIVHETDGSDTLDEDKPGKYIVNNLYRWHAITLGWGDIGYNYLIDSQGNIYEGRSGGPGVAGGHTFHEFCAKKDKDSTAKCNLEKGDVKVGYNFNAGTIGISILGHFASKKPTEAQKISLERLIAVKSAEFGIDPAGAVEWDVPITLKNNGEKVSSTMPQTEQDTLRESIQSSNGLLKSKGRPYAFYLNDIENPLVKIQNVPNIIAHSDIDWTLDPPENLYTVFKEARQLALADFNEIKAAPKTYKATLLSPQNQTITLKPYERKNITVTYHNDSSFTWHSFADNALILAEEDIKLDLGALGLFTAAKANNSYPGEKFKAQEVNIAPGETATFSIPVYPPLDATSTSVTYVLALDKDGWFNESALTITANNEERDYIAKLGSQNIPQAITTGNNYEVEMKYVNKGDKVWQKEKLFLRIADSNSISISNKKNNDSLVKMEETEVLPNGLATFKFNLKALKPSAATSTIQLTYQKVVNSILPASEQPLSLVAGSKEDFFITAKSPWRAEIAEQNFPASTLPSSRVSIKIKIKNTGEKAWSSKTILKIANADTAVFYDKNDWLNKETPAAIVERGAAPGKIVTFVFKLLAPKNTGAFNLKFKLEDKGQEVYFDKEFAVAMPVSTEKLTSKPATTPAKTTASTVYTVQSGDSLSTISAKYKISQKDIIALNKTTYPKIANNFLNVGWKLKISAAPAEPPAVYHTVKEGDNLSKIAIKYGVKSATIAELNKKEYPKITTGFLKIGWKLRIK